MLISINNSTPAIAIKITDTTKTQVHISLHLLLVWSGCIEILLILETLIFVILASPTNYSTLKFLMSGTLIAANSLELINVGGKTTNFVIRVCYGSLFRSIAELLIARST